jgi:signal transduction histidine kinase/CheY-like chemotaxis protein
MGGGAIRMRGSRPTWAGYIVAVGGVTGVTMIRLAMPRDAGGVYLLYTAVVMVATWYGGRSAGTLATVLGALAGNYWIAEPQGQFSTSPSALTTVVVFAMVAAVIILLCEDLLTTLQRLAALQRATESGLAHLDLQQLGDELLKRVTTDLHTDLGSVLVRDDDHLQPIATFGFGGERAVRIPIGSGFAGRVAEERRVIIINNVNPELLYSPVLRESGVRALVGAPLVVRGEVRGVVHIGSRGSRTFSRADAELLQVVADRLAMAIENARAYAREREERQRAEAASEAKDRFLATVSHELRTPLTVIMGWLWSLRSGTPEQRARATDAIERSSRTLSRLIDDLLDVARAISGKLQLKAEPVQLSEVVDKAAENIGAAIAAKDLHFTLSVDSDAAPVSGDSDRLQQVFWNLLANAAKFTPAGGSIVVRIYRTATNMTVSVADTGVGISREFLPHVFERFRQADDSSTREHGGLGLGLAIVRTIVELHGGTVQATSDGEGRGATFTVTLPIPALLAPTPAVGIERAAPAMLNGLRLLFVDDQPDAREAVRAVLEQFGATVMTASTVEEALRLIGSYRPDVVLADIAMPGEDGFALITRLKEQTVTNIPVAALTAFGPEHREKILGAGFEMYIAKPVHPPDLAVAVQRLAAREILH